MSYVDIIEAIADGTPIQEIDLVNCAPAERAAFRKLEETRQEDRRWRSVAQAFMQTATSISQLTDEDGLLDDIVKHARSLLNTDFAYISLIDPDAQTANVLNTSGILTTSYKNLRIRMGYGVLGKAAAFSTPAWTYDHLRDPEVSRDPDIDDIVRTEGVRALLAAPLLKDGSAFGALLVGHRIPHTFSSTDIVTLSSLASLAVVTMSTSNLVKELNQTVTNLEIEQSKTVRQLAELEQLSEAEQRLFAHLTPQYGNADFARTLSGIVGKRLRIWTFDPADTLPLTPPTTSASSTTEEFPEPTWDHILRLTQQSIEQEGPIYMDGQTVVVAVNGDRVYGTICVEGKLSTLGSRIMERAATSIVARTMLSEAVTAATGTQLEGLAWAILHDRHGEQDLRTFSKVVGLDPEKADFSILIILGRDAHMVKTAFSRQISDVGTLIEHEDHLCAVVDVGDDADSFLSPLLKSWEESGKEVFLGCTRLKSQVNDSLSAHEVAMRLAQSMRNLHKPAEIGSVEKHGNLGLLIYQKPEVIDALIERQLGPVLSYDAAHSTSLLRTWETYVDTGLSIAGTAKAMYVHINTVRQRLEKIQGLLDVPSIHHLDSLDHRLALRTWRLRTVFSY